MRRGREQEIVVRVEKQKVKRGKSTINSQEGGARGGARWLNTEGKLRMGQSKGKGISDIIVIFILTDNVIYVHFIDSPYVSCLTFHDYFHTNLIVHSSVRIAFQISIVTPEKRPDAGDILSQNTNKYTLFRGSGEGSAGNSCRLDK